MAAGLGIVTAVNPPNRASQLNRLEATGVSPTLSLSRSLSLSLLPSMLRTSGLKRVLREDFRLAALLCAGGSGGVAGMEISSFSFSFSNEGPTEY